MVTLSRWLFFGLAVWVLAGCGVNQTYELSAGNTPVVETEGPIGADPEPELNYLAGSFIDTDGNTIDLEQYKSKPTVLVFSSDTCEVCMKEAQAFNAYLGEELSSYKISLLTVMVGTFLEDAIWWKQGLAIPWTVGLDSQDLTLYKTYCEANEVPCTIVQTPDKGIAFKKIGEVHIDELETITGSWK